MSAVTKREFKLGDYEITALVMDREEFDCLCDNLEGVSDYRGKQFDIAKIKENSILPGLDKIPSSQWLFDKYEVNTTKLCAIVRGTADKFFNEFLKRE